MSEKVLVRAVNWVGDAIMSMPAIKSVKASAPLDELTLLAKSWVAPLFESAPYVDSTIAIDERFNGALGTIRLAGRLRSEEFKRAVLLPNSFGSALPIFLAGIPERVGYARDMRTFMLTKAVPHRGEDRRLHHIDYYLHMLRSTGISAKYSVPWIELSMEERLFAREKLTHLKKPVVGIHAGAQYGPAKRWFPERFASLIERIIDELKGSVVLFGSKAEAPLASDIITMVSLETTAEQVVSMAGKTTLRELAALSSECDALVTTDSGPMHVGYATRTPLVAIFGSTDPSLTGPTGFGFRVIRHDMECAPCFERECKSQDLRCMDAATVGEVFVALCELLPSRKAVFFDRDGTLCMDAGYLNNWNNFKVMDDITTLNSLINKGYNLFGITNQSGIARGIVDEGFVNDVNGLFVREHDFKEFYYCPHHPEDRCSCRKPQPEMLYRARAEHRVNLKASFVVGDKASDVRVAKAVGARAVFIGDPEAGAAAGADYSAPNLNDAVKWILSQ